MVIVLYGLRVVRVESEKALMLMLYLEETVKKADSLYCS